MSMQSYYVLLGIHILAVLAWTGTLASAFHTMRAHAEASDGEARAFVGLEKRTGIAMDASALIAIAVGLTLLLATDMGEIHLQHGYMHAKLTAVAALVGIHVYARIRMRKMRNGSGGAPPMWTLALQYALVIAIVVLITTIAPLSTR